MWGVVIVPEIQYICTWRNHGDQAKASTSEGFVPNAIAKICKRAWNICEVWTRSVVWFIILKMSQQWKNSQLCWLRIGDRSCKWETAQLSRGFPSPSLCTFFILCSRTDPVSTACVILVENFCLLSLSCFLPFSAPCAGR